MVSGTREQFAKNLEKYFPTEKEAIAKFMKILDVSFFLSVIIVACCLINVYLTACAFIRS